MRILCALATLPYKVRLRERDRPFSPILRRAPSLHRDKRYPLFFVRKEKLQKEKERGKNRYSSASVTTNEERKSRLRGLKTIPFSSRKF
jgi:hypothetical protein